MNTASQKHAGVGFDKRRNRWFATVKIRGRNKFLGYHETFERAVDARKQGEATYQAPLKEQRRRLEKEIIKTYLDGQPLEEVGRKFSMHSTTVYDILKKHNIQCRDNSKPLPIDTILKLYSENRTVEQIAESLEVSDGAVRRRLVARGVSIRPNRKYTIDETLFDRIDCEWKAYFLGLFYADGCVQKNNCLVISLHEKDKDTLEKLSPLIHNKPLAYTPPKNFVSTNGKMYQAAAKYSLQITNKAIWKKFQTELGCPMRKSLVLKFPTCVPDALMRHFIRGYLDGDGWVSTNRIGFISSGDFCLGLQKYLFSTLNIDSHYHLCGKVARLLVYKRRNLKELFHFLYDNASFYFPRKRDRLIIEARAQAP